jgi:hypothetical protein
MGKIRDVRRVVTGALEVQRTAKVIGASLEAAPVVHVDARDDGALKSVTFAEVCITSRLAVRRARPGGGLPRWPRCRAWRWSSNPPRARNASAAGRSCRMWAATSTPAPAALQRRPGLVWRRKAGGKRNAVGWARLPPYEESRPRTGRQGAPIPTERRWRGHAAGRRQGPGASPQGRRATGRCRPATVHRCAFQQERGRTAHLQGERRRVNMMDLLKSWGRYGIRFDISQTNRFHVSH